MKGRSDIIMSIYKIIYTVKYAFSMEAHIDGVNFPDKNLAAAIALERRKYDSIREIEKLKLRKIRNLNLEGLQYLSSLKELDIVECEVTNAIPLIQKVNISELYLYRNTGIEYSLLTALHNLRKLTIGDISIRSLNFLRELTQLEYLDLCANGIEDIMPLRHLKNLKILDLSENPITDCSPLGQLENLEKLYLLDVKLDNIGFITNLKRLKILDISGHNISDLSPLRGLASLEELYLEVFGDNEVEKYK
jgi:internalin A